MEISKPHKRNTLAAALLLASLLFSYLWGLIGPLLVPSLPTVPPQPTYAVVGVALLMGGICFAIWLGKQWAVWLFLFVFVLEVILPALDYERLLSGFRQQPLTLLSFVVTYGLQGYALWLLFKRG